MKSDERGAHESSAPPNSSSLESAFLAFFLIREEVDEVVFLRAADIGALGLETGFAFLGGAVESRLQGRLESM